MLGENNQGATSANPFDEKPIGKQHKFDIPEYAENEDPTVIVEHNAPGPRPLGERLKKNILKIKRQAMQELLSLVKNDPKEFETYQGLTPDFLAFKDPIVQDKGLKILNLYLSSGNELSIEPKSIIKVIIEKCLSLDKEEIKVLSQQVLFWYMDHKEQILLCQLNDYLLHKNRKVVGTSITFVSTLLNNYGIKRMKSLERFAKNLEYLSNSAKPVAKNETIHLFKEAYRWLGDSCLKDFKIHPEIKDEIVKFAKDFQKEPLEIKRGLATLKQKGQNKPVYYIQEEETENNEPVDVLNSYTSQWVNNLLKLQKWKEKKVALDQFITKIKVPCILPPREVSHFIFLIKKLLADKNINLCYCGFYITQNMSKGLKKNFSHIAKNILDEVFVKLKDLKTPTVQLTQATLKNLIQALSIDDFVQNIKDGLNDKSPQMKDETMKFMQNFFGRKEPKIMNTLRTFLDKIIQLTEDGTVKVRSQALETLCALKVIHGMKFFGQKIKKLDPKKLQTLELSKGPSKSQEMEIQEVQSKPQSVIQYPSESSVITVKPKENKKMQVEYEEAPKPNILPKNTMKSQESASVSSLGESKVVRSLNLNCLDDISNPNQSIRNTAYVQISTKFLSKDIKQFMKTIKNNSMKESSPTILKSILQIAKKYVNGSIVDLDLAEFLVKHDWKKMKQQVQEFIQNSKIASEADELMKSITSSLNVYKVTGFNSSSNPFTLKNFTIQLQNTMISKMSSPIDSIKKEVCQQAISFWENMPKIINETQFVPSNGWNEEHYSKLFNVVKCRLSDSNQQISGLYCRLLREMITKGITTKKNVLKTIAQMLYANIAKGIPEVKELFKQMTSIAPSYMFFAMQGQIFHEAKQSALVGFIIENSQLFIKHADFKAFIAPFLHLLCTSSLEMTLKQGLSSVFTQMVQISGQQFLQKEVSKLKITNFQAYSQYLKQFNINLNKSNYPNTGKNFRVKQDRLKYWQEQQWHLQITSNQVIKLINMMSNLGQPFSSLCTVFFLSEKEIRELDGLEFNFLAEYSDILFKYVFWRMQTDPLEAVQYLLRFTGRLVLAVGCHITQTDVIVLMRTFISAIERFKNTVKQEIVEILKRAFKIKSQLQKDTFQFWLNYLSSSSQASTNEILNIFMACYENNLAESFVQLARISTVHKYQLFINFLQHKFQIEHLTASGFRFDSSQVHNQGNDRLSQLGGPENMLSIQPSEVYVIYQIFQKNSEHCMAKLAQLAKLDGPARVQQYVKMLYSIIRPFFHGEIQIINMFCFLRELQKVLTEPYQTKRGQLRELTRMLLYLLVDLDQKPPNGNKCQEIMKIVNKCILTLIQTSESRHILEILFLLAGRHLQLGISYKIVHLAIKCMVKAAKTADFNLNLTDNLNFVIQQTNNLFQTHHLQPDSPFMKTLKHFYLELYKLYPFSVQILKKKIHQGELNPTFQFLGQQMISPEDHSVKQDQEMKREGIPSNVGNFSTAVLKKVCNIKSDPKQENM